MYKVLSDLTAYVFSDADPTKSWTRRRESQRGTAKLCNVMEQEVKTLTPLTGPIPSASKTSPRTLTGKALQFGAGRVALRATQVRGLVAGCPVVASESKDEPLLGEFGVELAQKLLGAGMGAREVAEVLVGTAAAFVANTATAVS